MNEPTITQYSRPMTFEDREELGPVSFDEMGYVVAIHTIVDGTYKDSAGALTEYH